MGCCKTEVKKEKKCCYMERVCDESCAAYMSNAGEHMPKILEATGLGELSCFRLVAEVAKGLSSVGQGYDDDDDYDDEDDDEEDWDEEDEDEDDKKK
ncbi:hypothetical protein CO110_05800 [Candidatus Desantisbacteria bacterium CG_4_9_14_3_um_filter_40_11]|uniref:Uncharacterized protein n=2 Tax=unclassified Candidatus Desantisiibacteriota TaxID=3106372 RepID=A0A2M8ATT7_9BACT|nr:MAG: hypothetical protein COX18_05625 [Candidatus Desantisbacteria bacterium CG23_combo_of_CG06-09_8_20_14_all_40_23]PJB29436.1 MAG: hypothetical protein CO110_05800 [Candidatus Desantisbacteria bacterium CG_4_9_14_3_um_filter_40_11]